MPDSRNEVLTGLDRVAAGDTSAFSGARLGVLMNQASVDRRLRPACDVLAEVCSGQLAAIFSPQHGLWGEQQANMVESPHGWHAGLQVPIYSLYSTLRRPTPEMLADIDCLVIDLQDVGSRVYTFIWTVSECLEACAASGVRVVVLDRPNPIGGLVEGPVLDPQYASFVGRTPIALRHGLTMSELTRIVARQLGVPDDFETVPVSNWGRGDGWPAEMTWIPPSPNLPTVESALVYPGQVLFEGTNVSEGRGTTTPFQLVGAPWIDGERLLDAVRPRLQPGLQLRAVRFVPTFDKWAGRACGGVCLHPQGPGHACVGTSIILLSTIAGLWRDEFEWLPPPYEYEERLTPIDILFGSADLRTTIDAADGGIDEATSERLTTVDPQFIRERADCLRYE